MAESSTFLTGTAAARGVNCSTRRASSTWRPRMRSMTRRALNGETRTNRAWALTPRLSWAWAFSDMSPLLFLLFLLFLFFRRPGSSSPYVIDPCGASFAAPRPPKSAVPWSLRYGPSSAHLAHSGGPLLGAVDAEGPGRRELAELVADHRLADVHGHVLAAVVDRDRVPDHVGDDGRAPGPGPDDPLVAPTVQVVDLLQQVIVNKRAFFERASHRLPPPPLAATAEDHLVGGLVAAAGAAL